MNWSLSKAKNQIAGGCRYLTLPASQRMKGITLFPAVMKIIKQPIQGRCLIYGGGRIKSLFEL